MGGSEFDWGQALYRGISCHGAHPGWGAAAARFGLGRLLSQHEGDVCVYELVEQFQLSQPTISHHLRILRDAQVIDLRKKGLYAYYYLRRTTLQQAQQTMASLFAMPSQQA